MLARLEAETRPEHGDVDGIWLEMFTGELTLTKYVGTLMRVYGFESPVEAALAYTPRLPSIIELRDRARSGLIAQDLIALGFGTAQVAQLPLCAIAPFSGPAEALGWMYVIQRSWVLHEQTKRHIDACLPHQTRGLSYLAASANRVQAWRQNLASVLDAFIDDEQMFQEVLRGARDGFERARDWFQTTSSKRSNRASESTEHRPDPRPDPGSPYMSPPEQETRDDGE